MENIEFEQYIRTLVNEPIAKFWTDEDIAILKKVGIINVFNQFWYILYPTHKTFVSKNRVANDPYIELPNNCFKVGKVEIASNGAVFPHIRNENKIALILDTNVPGTPLGWIWENKKIRQIPTPTASATDYYRIWYTPRLTQLSELPEELHPLVAIEAVLGAKLKDEDVTADLMVLQRRFSDLALVALAVNQLQEPDDLDDEEMGDLYGT